MADFDVDEFGELPDDLEDLVMATAEPAPAAKKSQRRNRVNGQERTYAAHAKEQNTQGGELQTEGGASPQRIGFTGPLCGANPTGDAEWTAFGEHFFNTILNNCIETSTAEDEEESANPKYKKGFEKIFRPMFQHLLESGKLKNQLQVAENLKGAIKARLKALRSQQSTTNQS